ncbi:hypothetical protein [Streptomyces sp. NPDC014791]|uniref:hypothetical protein n=1 Tax=Streptomyces sp. NPDC014791 TaxID=3364912 RepID=UPI0037014397
MNSTHASSEEPRASMPLFPIAWIPAHGDLGAGLDHTVALHHDGIAVGHDGAETAVGRESGVQPVASTHTGGE